MPIAPMDLVALAERVLLHYEDPSTRARLHLESSTPALRCQYGFCPGCKSSKSARRHTTSGSRSASS